MRCPLCHGLLVLECITTIQKGVVRHPGYRCVSCSHLLCPRHTIEQAQARSADTVA